LSDAVPARRCPARGTAAAQWLLAAAAVLLATAGCGRGGAPGFTLRPLVEARSYQVGATPPAGQAPPGLWFAAPPALGSVEADHELRPVVLTTGAAWTWTGRVPPKAELHAGVQLVPAAWQTVHRLQAVVAVHAGGDHEVLQVGRCSRQDPVWLDLAADLGRYAGRVVTLQFSANLGGLPPGRGGENLVAWGAAVSTPAPPPAAATRPNIVLILVDTLRRDRLTPYGYSRETSPEIARRLAAAGTVVENAYSQAPWTLPSVVSLFTGRYPGELLGKDLAAYGVPEGIEPLAERLGKAGYETAAFIANPTLHVGAGFERGFDTFYAPPADAEWLRRHAEDLNRHVLPWLAAHQDQERPFFLYIHYIDPHDPYENPEIVGNRSRFETDYQGEVTGEWPHGLYTGKRTLPNPARDLAHLSALYDGEVHYVDRNIGDVLAALRPPAQARTLVALTADHGEELFDHQGWKHGQTLYEEQIHVPLLFRWDGHIPAGQRLSGTVRLVDVAPTLATAAHVAADPGWQGVDLLPALTGAAALAERPAFAEGLSSGPLRAMAVLGRRKLIVFNRAEPFAPADELQAYLWRHDLDRMARVELYDLDRDPTERRNLAGPAAGDVPGAAAVAAARGGLAGAGSAGTPGAAESRSPAAELSLLATVIGRRLDRCLPGLRVIAAGIPAGSRLRIEVTLARPPRLWSSFLLGAADVVEAHADRVTIELVGADPLPRGIRIEDEVTGAGAGDLVLRLAATLDGRPLPPAQLSIASGAAYSGGGLTAAMLRASEWPQALQAPAAAEGAMAPNVAGGAGPVVAVWMHADSGESQRRQAGHDLETERRLRALGYIH
jgi:arylsulfatase A-like enzyme